jgi:creatinine amidohydrolase
MKSIFLNNMSWNDVKSYLKQRKDILLPFGAVEEHGYHLPLSTDGDIASALAQSLSEKTGVAIAPIIWYGVSNTTRRYPGTIMVRFDSFKEYVKDILFSLKQSRFTTIYLLSGHLSSSHIVAIQEASRDIKEIKAFFLDFSKLDFLDILETKPFHACEAETSLMLYLNPQKVDMTKANDEKIIFEDYAVSGLRKTQSGVFGSPTKATKEKGKLIFNRIIKEFTEVIGR